MQPGNDRNLAANVTQSEAPPGQERLQSREEQETTVPFAVPATFETFVLNEQTFGHLEEVAGNGRYLDGLVIDMMQQGFAIRLDIAVRLTQYAERLLSERGVMLLLKSDGAISYVKEELGRGLSYTYHPNPMDIFVRYPRLAEHVCATVPGIERRRLSTGSPLTNHILQTSVPVLTPKGGLAKHEVDLPPKVQWLIQLSDGFTPVEAIAWKMDQTYNVPADETLRLLQECERQRLIYPLFPRLQFLSNCYRKQQTFRLGRYMVAAGIITEDQLKDLLEQQAEHGHGRSDKKLFLGLLAIKAGFINTRELEILLADQYLYGGYRQISGEGSAGALKYVETMRESMLGTLGAIETPGLLQSIVQAKKSGLLSMEDRGQSALVAFQAGKLTHAKLGRLLGADAIIEIVVGWKEGIFIFRDQAVSQELDDSCQVSQSLDRLLMDAALAEDQINQILNMLPNGRNAVLEPVFNFESAWNSIIKTPLRYFDDTPVGQRDLQMLYRLASSLDGLSSIDEVHLRLNEYPLHVIIRGAYLLLENGLVVVQQASFFRILSHFQTVISRLQQHVSPTDNVTILKKSLYYVHGESAVAQRFKINEQIVRVSIDLNEVKKAGIPISAIISDLQRWMQTYLAYCRKLLGTAPVDAILNQALSAHPDQAGTKF